MQKAYIGIAWTITLTNVSRLKISLGTISSPSLKVWFLIKFKLGHKKKHFNYIWFSYHKAIKLVENVKTVYTVY